jgi:hypothetical protein
MKLCSQCEFIYEDDQELCDMDGAQLVYEPTLDHVFPKTGPQARTELERQRPGRFVIPLSRSQQPQHPIAQPHVVATRSRLALQLGAGLILALAGFAAFYATPHLFQTSAQSTQSSKSEIPPVVFAAPTTADKPEIQNAKLELTDQSATRQEKRETEQPADILNRPSSPRDSAIPPLPGLKPLPRLKPLPTLHPIPKFTDKSPSANPPKKGIVVNTSGNTKKDSRFGSFLKKTGRILTKPFKS